MLNRSIASMASRAVGGTYDVQEFFWGTELSKENDSFTWTPDVDEDMEDMQQNILFLKRAVLGVKAKEGERNIIEVHCKDMEGNDVKHPILSLTLGRDDHADVELTFKQVDEVTFKLIQGSGPLHLVGQTYIETMNNPEMDDTDLPSDEEADEEVEDEDEEEEEEDEAVGKKRKMASPKGKKNGVADGSPNIKAMKAAVAANGKASAKKMKAS